jgi:hypothetical protein
MARPTVQSLNRNPGISGERQRQSPGVAVQAPLSVNVAPNSFQALAEILGVGAGIATDQAAQANAARVQEEQEVIALQAEANFHGDTLDEEAYQRSRTYRTRYDTLKGARAGTEAALRINAAAEDFVKANPLADEKTLREHLISLREGELKDENGLPREFMLNPRTAAIVESVVNETSYKIIAGHRAGYQARLKEKTGDEAEGLFLADGRQKGGTSLGNLEAYRTQLKASGYTDEEANKKVANSALALARNLKDPKILDLVPEVWSDGSLGPKSDAETLSTLDTQRTIVANVAEAERLEKLKPVQLDFIGKIDTKVREGVRLTEEDKKAALDLGFTPNTIASWDDQAARTAIRLAEKAAEDAEKARKEAEEWQDIQANPFSYTNAEREKAYGAQYDAAVKSNNPQAAAALVRQAVATGVLPRTVRNYLDRIPGNPQEFAQWRKTMAQIDDLDDQVFASLGQDARTAYAAYNGLMAVGRFTPEQAFVRLQARDPERGEKYVQSKRGEEAINAVVGANAGSLERQKAAEFVRTFASLADFTDEEASRMAKAAFEKTYLVQNGKVFHRSVAPTPEFLRWAAVRYAEDRTKKGEYTEADDVVISPIEGTTQLLFTIRGEPTLVNDRLEASVLHGQLKQTGDRMKRAAEAPAKAASSAVQRNLNPWRYESGESGLQRQQRAGRENAERRRMGLPEFPTPISWENANRNRSK